MMLETPVLFLVFNRPHLAKRVFAKIKEQKPKRLFIAADGPRSTVKGESNLCDATRRGVLDEIDWDCQVETLFRSANLGCGLSVSDAISWFFEQNEMGIILEDDCLPSTSFFQFCDVLLNYYKNEEKVYSIGGTNIFERWGEGDKDYLFSYQGSIWGWASWRRAWDKYEFEHLNCDDQKVLGRIRETSGSEVIFDSRLKAFANATDVDTWDYQWLYARLSNRGFSILPARNLVANIGFGPEATHTKSADSFLGKLKTIEFSRPIRPREHVVLDEQFEKEFTEKLYASSVPESKRLPLLRHLLEKVRVFGAGRN